MLENTRHSAEAKKSIVNILDIIQAKITSGNTTTLYKWTTYCRVRVLIGYGNNTLIYSKVLFH